MGQQVANEPDLMLEVNDFSLIFPSFLEMIWLTIHLKPISLFVDTKSISRLSGPSLTLFLSGGWSLQSAVGGRTNASVQQINVGPDRCGDLTEKTPNCQVRGLLGVGYGQGYGRGVRFDG